MLLGFKTKINGNPTYFVEKILACFNDHFAKTFRPKKHTIRRGKRWKKGMKLHFATGVRTKACHQFAGYSIGFLEYCISTQDIIVKNFFDDRAGVMVDGMALSDAEIQELALNDGFDTVDAFWDFFSGECFEGQLIHWTDLKY